MTKMSSSINTRLQDIFTKSPKPISTIASNSTIEQEPKPYPISSPSIVKTLVENFKTNSRKPEFRSRQDRYQLAVRRLADGNHFSAIETILEYQKKFKDSMSDEGFVVKLISLYGKVGMFDHAYKVFDEMPSFGCARSVISFNAILYACVNSKKFDKVREFFVDLPGKLGVEPNVVSYNTVIHAFCVANDFDSALELLEKMEKGGVSPDTVSYNTIFEAYYKEKRFVEAEKLWRRMEEKGVVANVRTYNAKLRSLMRNDRVEEALELVEKMINEEVELDKYSYNAVISGCVSSGKLKEAKIWHSKMVGDDCLPDNRTYGLLIPYACEKRDVDFALELTKKAVELKVYVNRKSMQRVVNMLIDKSRMEEAVELVSQAKSSKRHQYTIRLPVPE